MNNHTVDIINTGNNAQNPKSKIQYSKFGVWKLKLGHWTFGFGFWILGIGLLATIPSCSVYTFKDISIDYTKVKTIKISYFENKARYVDPQFSPQFTDKLRQKITNQTRLTQVQTDDANYDVSGYISDFSISTSGVSNQQASTNRLTVSIHLIFKNRVNEKQNKETDISRNFDYSANLTFTDAEPQLLPTILTNMTDEVFNAIFSNW